MSSFSSHPPAPPSPHQDNVTVQIQGATFVSITEDSVTELPSEILTLPVADFLPIHLQARLKANCRPRRPHSEKAHSRRQLFLDSRRKRLQARSDHVERVRLNHAQPDSTSSARLVALEKSLLHAKKTRDSLLAKTAASCAQEVAKAKQVAREMKRKRSEETQALRHEMEGRLAEAEKRRLEIQKQRTVRKHRGSSASVNADCSADEKSQRPDAVKAIQEAKRKEAAILLQRAYRNHRNALIVKQFTGMDINIDCFHAIPFEAATQLVQSEKVRTVTARLLELCGLLSEHDEQDMAVEQSCRVFLSAYLILSHPAEVLLDGGKEETALMTQSRDLLCALENWISSASKRNFYAGSFPLRRELAACWRKFSTAFLAWKDRDSKTMLQGMLDYYVELEAIWHTVKDEPIEYVAKDFKEGIRKNQIEAYAGIRKLVGDKTRANELIKNAVQKARKERTRQTPRGAFRRDESPDETAPARKSPRSLATEVTLSGRDAPVPAAPVQVVVPTVVPTGSVMPSNREVMHEIAIDGEFRLKEIPRTPLEAAVAKQMKRAFFDDMKERITRGDLTSSVPGMAKFIKEKLLQVVSRKSSYHKLISEALDNDIIEQQCRAGAYDFDRFFAFVLWLLPKICSPARDEEVRELTEGKFEHIVRLEKLVDVLEKMHLDYLSFLININLKPEAIPYEQEAFAEDLTAGRTSLTRTREWLHASAGELSEEANKRSAPDAPKENITPSFLAIYNNALLSSAISLEPLDTSKVPETLQLDHDRLRAFRSDTSEIVVSAAIITMVKNLLRRDARTSWPELKDAIGSLSKKPQTAANPTQFATELCKFVEETNAMPQATQQHMHSAVTRIRKTLINPSQVDPVVRVVFNRLKQFVRSRLNASSDREKARLNSANTASLASMGMVEYTDDVSELLRKLDRLADVNRKIYDKYYNSILRDFLEADQQASASQ